MRNFLLYVLLPLTLTGAVFTLAVLAARLLWRRVGARGQKAALLLAAFLFIVPFGLFAAAPSTSGEPSALQQTIESSTIAALPYGVGRALSAAAPQPETPVELSAAVDKPRLSAAQAVGFTYIVGVVAVGAIMVLRALRFHRSIKATRKRAPSEQQFIFTEIKRQIGIRQDVLLFVDARVKSPLLVGLFRPKVILPESSLDEQTLRFALHHELTHLKAGDLWSKAFVCFVAALHWFNPAAWLLRRQFEQSCERCCDESVLQHASPRERMAYADALLGFCGEQRPYVSSAFAKPAHQLKARLAELLHPKKKNRALQAALALCVFIALALSLLVGCGLAADGAQQPDDLAGSGDVYGDGLELNTRVYDPYTQKYGAALVDAEYIDPKILLGWPTAEPYFVSRGSANGHAGIDIGGETGLGVCAAEAGTVSVVDKVGETGFGKYIVVDHGDGLLTLYACLDETFVDEGAEVTKGDMIARMGATGNSTGPHLHFEVQINGLAAEPEPFLGLE